MKYSKNQKIKLRFNDIGSDGEGIGRTGDGATFFVKGALPGEEAECTVLKWKNSYGYAKLDTLTVSSKDRVTPVCPIADKCGGCTLQHLDYKAQLEWKRNKVLGCLERIGGFEGIEVLPTLGMEQPLYYRNKAQFPVKGGDPVKIGFYAGHTHAVIDTESCYIQAPVINEILKVFRGFVNEKKISVYDEEAGKGLLRHILIRTGFETGEVCVCPIINGNKLPFWEEFKDSAATACEKLNHKLTTFAININTEKTNVILGNKVVTLWGKEYITDKLGEVSYCISPLSFYQVNPVQTRKIYDTVRDMAGLTGHETLWDIYCGAGTIGLYLSDSVKELVGIEIVPEAIEDAKRNAKANGVGNVEYYCGAAEEVLPVLVREKGKTADVAVIDPPRKGCDAALLNTLLDVCPEKIIYVSCDPATLARDLKLLCAGKYSIRQVRPVDAFCQTTHVESCVLLQRVSNTRPKAITLDVEMEDYYRIKGDRTND